MTMRSKSFSERILRNASFIKWCQKEESRNADSIALYTSILEFESKLKSGSPSLSLLKLARHIHRKYVSLNTGTCHVIDDSTRTEMSKRVHEVLDGKPPYVELFDPLKQPLFQHLKSMHTEYSTTTADINTTWEDASSTSSSNKGAMIWFNDDAIDRSSRHEIGQNTVTHESEDDRFAFFNAVCTRLNSLQETKNSSETEESPEKPKSSSSSNPYGNDGFAPPPHSTHTNTMKVSNLPKRFESLYKKKRQQNVTSDSSGFGSNASDFWSFERYGKSNHGTLERPNRLFPGSNNGFSTLQHKKRSPEVQKLTVELRYENDVPMIAKISANQSVTLRYFRHLFGLHYTDSCRFFFKSMCEDGSAQYQWTLLFQDDDILPVFQNRITAICRMCPPPEEHHLI
ncbi:CRE-AXL-1 protein [Caenorhabditis remanei]|uniref:CRE-AXL-1 protein n=1 Tax=Caenorhabditis remanei TaxID=31234 RepID=E3LV80_CAERE|nr:CRE-AXL-1 protein [Caenorhabditis remanei]